MIYHVNMTKTIFKILSDENFIDLNMIQFGYEEVTPLKSFGPTKRNHFLFHYIINGKGKLISDNDKGETITYDLEAGQGFLLYPQQTNYYVADSEEPWTYMWVEFDGMKAREICLITGLTFNQPIYEASNKKGSMSVKNELLYLIEHKENAPLELMGHLYLLLSNLIGTSINRKEKSGNNMLEFYLHEARIFIEQNYHRDISAEDVAHVCNLSRVYLSKIFKSKFNTTLQEFIIQFRMSKAQELLKTTDYSVTKISEMVGYQNAFNFSRAFKKITGISPRDWRIKNSIIQL